MVRGVDSVQTSGGNVVIQDSNARLSVRSQRRGGKGKNVPNPAGLWTQLKAGGKKVGEGVHEMFQSFERESPTFAAFFKKENESKNRFPTEVLLYDKSRVVLKDDAAPGDYYHASFVDGSEQARQYVCAQAPFTAETEVDFVRLLVQLKPDVVVLLMKLDSEGVKMPFGASAGDSATAGPFTVKTEDVQKDKNFECLSVSISGSKLDLPKTPVCIFSSWNDDAKIPVTECNDFFNFVRKSAPNLKAREASQVLVCPSGAHRAGAWALLDGEGERIKAKGRIRFTDSAKNVRFQRSNAIDSQEVFDQVIQAFVAIGKSV